MKQRFKGFSLIEILIVVGIVGVLSTLVVLNVVRARSTANESTAINTMRTIATQAESFRVVQTPISYPNDLDALSGAIPPYIPSFITEGATVQGYMYSLTGIDTDGDGNNEQYVASCLPVKYGESGNRTFSVVEDSILRGNDQGAAGVHPNHAQAASWSSVSGM